MDRRQAFSCMIALMRSAISSVAIAVVASSFAARTIPELDSEAEELISIASDICREIYTLTINWLLHADCMHSIGFPPSLCCGY